MRVLSFWALGRTDGFPPHQSQIFTMFSTTSCCGFSSEFHLDLGQQEKVGVAVFWLKSRAKLELELPEAPWKQFWFSGEMRGTHRS